MRGVVSGRGIQVQGAITVEQFLHCHGVIHPGAIAWENAGLGVDIQTVLAVQGFDVGAAKRLRGVFRRRLDDAPVGADLAWGGPPGGQRSPCMWAWWRPLLLTYYSGTA